MSMAFTLSKNGQIKRFSGLCLLWAAVAGATETAGPGAPLAASGVVPVRPVAEPEGTSQLSMLSADPHEAQTSNQGKPESPSGGLSNGAIQAQLQALSGDGWGDHGPGGACIPVPQQVTCLDAEAAQGFLKDILGSLLDQELLDPELLNAFSRIQGFRSVLKPRYLEISVYFDGTFDVEISDALAEKLGRKAGQPVPLRRVSVPKVWRLNVFSNNRGVNIQRSSRSWRQTSVKVMLNSAPFQVYLQQGVINLQDYTISLRAGVGDLASVWVKTPLSPISPRLDGKRTFFDNLGLLMLPWVAR